MMSRLTLITGLLLSVLFISLPSCMSEDDFPVVPSLKYYTFLIIPDAEGEADEGILILKFTDGDGDIGLANTDTFPPFNPGSEYFYNFHITLFKKLNGQYEKVQFPDTTFTYSSRIPKVELTGNSKAIKGELEYTFNLKIMNMFLGVDTIRIETYIYDRALHKSNIVTTPDICVK